MKTNNLYTGEEAQAKVLKGFNAVADAVKGTLGAAGYNAIIGHHLSPFSYTTNDGVSIARAIELADPLESMGADIAKEITSRSDKEGGDGTTTAITLAQAILTEAQPYLKEIAPMELDRQLNECLPLIEASIDAQKKIITPSEVKAVASISAESEEIGSLMQEIYEQIGKDGILYPDISNTFETYYTLGKGIKIRGAKLLSPYLADVDVNGNWLNNAQLQNAHILLVKQKITAGSDLSDFLYKIYHQTPAIKEIAVFCDEIEANAIASFFKMKVREKEPMKVVLIKMPTIWKDLWYEDLAKLTGATVVDGVGLTLKKLSKEHLGMCAHLATDFGNEMDENRNNTYLDGTKDISEWITELETRADDDSKIRAARLNTKTARLFVGAKSDTELTYKRLKVEDARNAAFLAMKDGIVAGGGVALKNTTSALPQTIGGKILINALFAPVKQIATNAGIPDMVIGDEYEGTHGYDTKNNKFVDMFEAGIVDPASVTKSSVRNALSVASKLLTARVFIPLPPKEPEPMPQLPLQ